MLDWLAALDGVPREALRDKMSQKELRQWKRKAPGHRGFTVLRHPARRAHDAFVAALSDLKDVHFSPRKRCEWGTWGIVAASQGAAELMLSRFPKVAHVYLASGSCLPLRPVQELIDYLEDRPQTDFIEKHYPGKLVMVPDRLAEGAGS